MLMRDITMPPFADDYAAAASLRHMLQGAMPLRYDMPRYDDTRR